MAAEKTVSIALRVTPEFKHLLDQAARRDQRTKTNLLEKLLVDHCRAIGLIGEESGERPGVLSGTSGSNASHNRA